MTLGEYVAAHEARRYLYGGLTPHEAGGRDLLTWAGWRETLAVPVTVQERPQGVDVLTVHAEPCDFTIKTYAL